jgi:hypothetical protein
MSESKKVDEYLDAARLVLQGSGLGYIVVLVTSEDIRNPSGMDSNIPPEIALQVLRLASMALEMSLGMSIEEKKD